MSQITELCLAPLPEALPTAPTRRLLDEPLMLSPLAEAQQGDHMEIMQPDALDMAIGRCTFQRLTVIGGDIPAPVMVVVCDVHWYGASIVTGHLPGLLEMPEAGPLLVPVTAHMLRPLPSPHRCTGYVLKSIEECIVHNHYLMEQGPRLGGACQLRRQAQLPAPV